jgi:hypothetical protein
MSEARHIIIVADLPIGLRSDRVVMVVSSCLIERPRRKEREKDRRLFQLRI